MQTVLKLGLVSHGMTEAMRAARFPADEPLTPAGRRSLSECGPLTASRVSIGPECRTSETADVLGLQGMTDYRLRDLGAGDWRGRELTSIPEPDLHRWLTDPEFCGHGGESVVAVIERTRDWLAEIVAHAESTIAVTHPAIVRAALLITLDAPPESFWRIDIAPGSVTRMHYRGAWTLRLTV
ncbi:histidine phosphatase family protein [Nocardia sp. CNY236]|uniref:histidine phosphatase family protein n=1 Tax=Nocardia sp. CNY236 TaxID=1169152 RepID=UPI00048E2586|nr:histidine phosphatase family protein [Nocardia sp. CNY236]